MYLSDSVIEAALGDKEFRKAFNIGGGEFDSFIVYAKKEVPDFSVYSTESWKLLINELEYQRGGHRAALEYFKMIWPDVFALFPEHDTINDAQNKSKKKRQLNNYCVDCIRRYTADKLNRPMKTHVEEYVEETGKSTFGGIMRILNDHSDLWKGD